MFGDIIIYVYFVLIISDIDCITEFYMSNIFQIFSANPMFSILGDSLSTLEGYNPYGYAVFYEGAMCYDSEVMKYEDTWWGQTILHFGGELLENNSWSGSLCSRLGMYDLSSHACGDERCEALGNGNIKPDCIIVNIGTNDWGWGVLPMSEDKDREDVFENAYNLMLRKLKNNYPNAKIFCCSLSMGYSSHNPDYVFPQYFAGYHISEYCKVIEKCARENGCAYLDLINADERYDTVDGFHPNKEGMKVLSKRVIEQMEKTAAELWGN